MENKATQPPQNVTPGNKKIKTALGAVGATVALAAVIFLLFAYPGHSLSVESSPPEAEVLLDGKVIGKTPMTITGVGSGKHKLVIRKKDYQNFSTEIDTAQESRKTISTTLTTLHTTADIDSVPAGATVELDGRLLGTTPLTTGKIKSGEHSLKLRLEGYTVYAEKIDISGNKPNKLLIKLKSNVGTVIINSIPQGADISFDGENIGKTPLTIERQPQGKHFIKLSLESFANYSKEIQLNANSTVKIAPRLKSRQKIRLSLPRKNYPKGNYIYFLSHEKYLSPSRFMESVKMRYGNDVTLVDWNEIKKQFKKGLPAFLNGVGLKPRGSALVSCKGKISYAPDRGYFIARLDGRAPRKLQTHDDINNFYLALASWKTRNPALLRAPRY